MTAYEDVWEAPSFEEFYRVYRRLVWAIGDQKGVHPDHLMDAVHEVFTRVLEKNMLATYDPSKVPFKNWISVYVGLTMLGLRDKARSRYREIPIGLNLTRLLTPESDDWTELVETAADLHRTARVWRFEEPEVYATWEAAQTCARRTGGLAVADLALDLGSSPTTAFTRLWRLREAACAATGKPMPARRPRVLR